MEDSSIWQVLRKQEPSSGWSGHRQLEHSDSQYILYIYYIILYYIYIYILYIYVYIAFEGVLMYDRPGNEASQRGGGHAGVARRSVPCPVYIVTKRHKHQDKR